MKTCTKCKVEQPKSEFSKRSVAKDGLKPDCKSCRKTYYQENKEREREVKKKWKEQNRNHFNQYHNQYKKLRKKTDTIYKLRNNLRSLLGCSLRKHGYTKKSKAHQLLGASYEVVKAHLEQTYLTNYGVPYSGQPIHINHIIPCASASSEAELIALQHYTNLQYLTPEDNLKKSDN